MQAAGEHGAPPSSERPSVRACASLRSALRSVASSDLPLNQLTSLVNLLNSGLEAATTLDRRIEEFERALANERRRADQVQALLDEERDRFKAERAAWEGKRVSATDSAGSKQGKERAVQDGAVEMDGETLPKKAAPSLSEAHLATLDAAPAKFNEILGAVLSLERELLKRLPRTAAEGRMPAGQRSIAAGGSSGGSAALPPRQTPPTQTPAAATTPPGSAHPSSAPSAAQRQPPSQRQPAAPSSSPAPRPAASTTPPRERDRSPEDRKPVIPLSPTPEPPLPPRPRRPAPQPAVPGSAFSPGGVVPRTLSRSAPLADSRDEHQEPPAKKQRLSLAGEAAALALPAGTRDTATETAAMESVTETEDGSTQPKRKKLSKAEKRRRKAEAQAALAAQTAKSGSSHPSVAPAAPQLPHQPLPARPVGSASTSTSASVSSRPASAASDAPAPVPIAPAPPSEPPRLSSTLPTSSSNPPHAAFSAAAAAAAAKRPAHLPPFPKGAALAPAPPSTVGETVSATPNPQQSLRATWQVPPPAPTPAAAPVPLPPRPAASAVLPTNAASRFPPPQPQQQPRPGPTSPVAPSAPAPQGGLASGHRATTGASTPKGPPPSVPAVLQNGIPPPPPLEQPMSHVQPATAELRRPQQPPANAAALPPPVQATAPTPTTSDPRAALRARLAAERAAHATSPPQLASPASTALPAPSSRPASFLAPAPTSLPPQARPATSNSAVPARASPVMQPQPPTQKQQQQHQQRGGPTSQPLHHAGNGKPPAPVRARSPPPRPNGNAQPPPSRPHYNGEQFRWARGRSGSPPPGPGGDQRRGSGGATAPQHGRSTEQRSVRQGLPPRPPAGPALARPPTQGQQYQWGGPHKWYAER